MSSAPQSTLPRASRRPGLRRRWLALCGSLCAICTLLPALLVAAGPPSLETREIAPGVFLHPGVQEDVTPQNLGGIANIGFVVGDKCVAVIDSGGSKLLGEALRAAVQARTDKPVCYVVNTHV